MVQVSLSLGNLRKHFYNLPLEERKELRVIMKPLITGGMFVLSHNPFTLIVFSSRTESTEYTLKSNE